MSDEIRTLALHSVEQMIQVEQLQRAIWPASETDIVPAHLLVTVARNGGVVLGAMLGERMVGFVLGFLGTDEGSPGRPALARLKHCSHMMGVHPDFRDRGVAYRLKSAQRQQVLEQGIRLATWTYDPLLSVNAYLNIGRLGAICRRYRREVYGAMRDGLNEGLPSDRFEVEWWVTSNRVSQRMDQKRKPLEFGHFLAGGAQQLAPAEIDDRGLPRPNPRPARPAGAVALAEIPSDFLGMKEIDLPLAAEWRAHSRELFEAAFAAGYMVTDFVHDRRQTPHRSYYVLSQGDSTLG
jgi:predicted GNAT superfamily acetyltransferase